MKEMLKYTTAEAGCPYMSVACLNDQVLSNFQRQYDHYKSEFDSSGAEGKFKQRLTQGLPQKNSAFRQSL